MTTFVSPNRLKISLPTQRPLRLVARYSWNVWDNNNDDRELAIAWEVNGTAIEDDQFRSIQVKKDAASVTCTAFGVSDTVVDGDEIGVVIRDYGGSSTKRIYGLNMLITFVAI